jgi:hypothetical protein
MEKSLKALKSMPDLNSKLGSVAGDMMSFWQTKPLMRKIRKLQRALTVMSLNLVWFIIGTTKS